MMQNILNYKILDTLLLSMTVSNLLLIGVILLIAGLIQFSIKRFTQKMVVKDFLDVSIAGKLYKIASLFVYFIAFSVIVSTLGVDMSYEIMSIQLIQITPKHVVVVLIIFMISRILLVTIQAFFARRVNSNKLDLGTSHSFFQITKYVVWIIAIAAMFQAIGIQITLLIAGMGALLVGLGFGVQNIFNDIVSGIIVLFERSIKVNDVVEVDSIVCRVKQIGIRTSLVVTRDNVEMIIPNSRFTSDKIINWTHSADKTRFHIKLGVAYGSDVQLIKKILIEEALAHPRIEKIPEPVVLFSDFGSSSLDFILQFWTTETFRVDPIMSDLRFAIDKAFREQRVEIPYSKHDIYIKEYSQGNLLK